MKTFGDLQEGDIILMYDLIKIVARKITSITKDGPKTRMIHLEGRKWPVSVEKSLSIQDNTSIYRVCFSCKDAVEDYLLNRTRIENERHSMELKTIQELKEQYESLKL